MNPNQPPLYEPENRPGLEPLPTDPAAMPPPEEDNINGRRRISRESVKSVVSTILILLAAPLIALCLTSFVFQSYEVDGPSMQTTLQNHDRLIVLKTARTWSRVTRHPYIPHRGDIIVFVKPGALDFVGGGDKQLIKRVIGLPGERVVVSQGTLTVYNNDNPNGFHPDDTMSYGSVIGTTPGDVNTVVPPDQVFVCGDNRTNSLDSRAFGTVPVKGIIGKLKVRILPLDKIQNY